MFLFKEIDSGIYRFELREVFIVWRIFWEMKRGLWVNLEGIDYSGKLTQSARIFEALVGWNEDLDVFVTHEPTVRAREIKERLKGERGGVIDGTTMMHLYMDDRQRHQHEFLYPLLEKGVAVITNRFKYSTEAYQGAQGVSVIDIRNGHNDRGIGTPDITFVFDIDEEAVRKRSSASSKTPDIFEKDLVFQMNVRSQYQQIVGSRASHDRGYYGAVYLIDARDSPAVVAGRVRELLEPAYVLWSKV